VQSFRSRCLTPFGLENNRKEIKKQNYKPKLKKSSGVGNMIPPTGGGAKSKVKNPEMTEGIRATTWVCPYIEQRNGTG